MGYAIDHLSENQLAEIARSLFKVKSEEQGKGELHGLCPIHGEENPSFSYNYQKDTYFCLSCNAKGDIIDLWCQVNGHGDKKEGFKAFLAAHGIHEQSGSTSTGTQPPPAQKKKEKKKDPPKIIPEDIFQDMPPLPDSWIDRLTETRGWSRDVIQELDLRQQTYYLDKTDGKIKKFKGKPQRIALPIRDDEGKKLLNLRLYKPDAKVNKIISWGKGYGSSRLYPSPAHLKPDLPIVICEGESDTNCARSQDLNAITQTAKLTKWPKDHSKHFKNRDVIICYDADLPGIKYSTHAAESLYGVAKSIRLIEWPEYMGLQEDGTWPKKGGQDLTDFFVKHQKP